MGWQLFPYYTDKETDSERLRGLSKIAQLVTEPGLESWLSDFKAVLLDRAEAFSRGGKQMPWLCLCREEEGS